MRRSSAAHRTLERRGSDIKPFADGSVTATEAIIAACGLVRALDLSPFDVAMWFHRMPRALTAKRETHDGRG
jgi:hypothetical protein